MKTTLLVILMALPIRGSDAAPELEPRMRVVADAVAVASVADDWPDSRESLAGLLVSIGYYESGYSRRIGEGRCGPNECDAVRGADGRIWHRARSYWQIQQSALVPLDDWRRMVGTGPEPVRLAASTAARLLVHGRLRCGTQSGAVSLYATGKTCRWSGATQRVALARRVERALGVTP